jgi:hypothetical protein
VEEQMPTFEPLGALEAFRRFLDVRGLSETSLSVRDGFEAMFDFYRDMRADGCASEDADMLLFQWGAYDWAGGTVETFELDLTRQLIIDERGEDDDIWQLGLTFEFEPTDQLRALGKGNRWGHSTQELPQFREHVLASAPLTACNQLRIRRTKLDYGCAG